MSIKKTRLERLCELHSQTGGTIFQFNRLYKCEILDLSDAAFDRRFGSGMHQWVFNWFGGGYNAVMAANKLDAINAARKITSKLNPANDTFRVVEMAEMNEIDKQYRSLCD